MKDLIKMLIWVFFIILAFVLQANHFLSLGAINPNLILLVIFGGVIAKKKILEFLILISATVLLSTVFLPYWLKEILILGSLGILALLLKKLLTGNNFFDFLILILLGTLGFYSIINFRYLFANPPAIAAELIYNVILGLITIFVVKNFFYEEETGIKS